MVAAEDFRNLILRRLRCFLGNGRTYDSAQIGLCQDSLHHGGVWGEHEVILVHSHGVVTLLLEHTYYTERDAVETYYLADRVAAVGEEIIHYGLPQDADLGCCLDVGISKHFSICHLQLSDAQVVLVHAIDGTLRIVVAVYPLSRTVYGRRNGTDVITILLDALVVCLLQGLHRGSILSHTASHVGTRRNHNHIATHLGDIRLDARLTSLSDGKHRNHGCNTDDDAQGCEEGAHLVGCYRPDGNLKKILIIHILYCYSSVLAGRAARPSAAERMWSL